MPITNYPVNYTDALGRARPLPFPSTPVAYSIKPNVLVTTFESGHEQRRKKGEPLRAFEFTYQVLDYYQMRTLQQFFLARSGTLETFYWQDSRLPGRPTFLVRFDMESFSPKKIGTHYRRGPLFELTIKLQQTFI